jgi:hypothetical protein
MRLSRITLIVDNCLPDGSVDLYRRGAPNPVGARLRSRGAAPSRGRAVFSVDGRQSGPLESGRAIRYYRCMTPRTDEYIPPCIPTRA